MKLLAAHLIPGLLSLALGGALLSGHPAVSATAKTFPRSQRAAWVLFGAGAAWFLWIVAHLGEADLIFPRPALFVGFTVLGAMSFVHARDFLAVRGLAILLLLGAWEFLYAGYMDYRPELLPLKIGAYALMIVPALFLAGYPYWMRDGIAWLFARPGRARLVGAAWTLYGGTLTALAFVV